MADSGLVRLLGFGLRFATSKAAAFYVGIKLASDPSASFYFNLPNALPDTTKALVCDTSGNLGYASLGGGGTVTSVDVSLPDSIFSASSGAIISSGTISFTLDSQSANSFFAGPTSGGAATPAFRAIAWNDISSLAGTSGSSFAIGNDSRFHTQGTDTGTNQTSFQIDSGNSGARLKNSSGTLQVRNAADNANADLVAANLTLSGNLTVQGTTTTINSETLTIDDNVVVLNNNVSSGSPTEDGGIQVRRGASTSAAITWDETNDLWKAGLAGSEAQVARIYRTAFTNSSLVSGVLTITHNLGQQIVLVQISDNNGKTIPITDDVTLSSSSQSTVDLTSFGTLSGTWNAVVTG